MNGRTESFSEDRTITLWELRQLEDKPKSRARLTADRSASAFPIAAALLLLAHYKLAANVRNAVPTDTYSYFIGFLAALLTGAFVCSFFSKELYSWLLKKAPLYSVLFLLLGLYDFATLKTGILPMPYFPWPDRILNALWEDRALLMDCVKNSLVLLFTGYAAGVVVGLLTGIMAGWSARVRYWVTPLIQVLGPIPATTWLPIILIVAASLFGGSAFLIALGVWYPVTMTSMNGVLNISKINFEVARTLGADKKWLVFKVAIPAAMPQIFQGLTQGMSVACTALMVAEMMGVESGLGWYINWQRGWAEFAKMYGAVIVICLTFTAVNFTLSMIKRRVLRWQR
ncbi:MAG: ABC transporter permease subunit [Synergistaceae bacterium]|jgi:NitT/TauT family transport system permease protein|nr:ABC transporter permease subunit [Synergistaceae bacterium]